MGGTLNFIYEGLGCLGGAVMRIVLFCEQRKNYAGESLTWKYYNDSLLISLPHIILVYMMKY